MLRRDTCNKRDITFTRGDPEQPPISPTTAVNRPSNSLILEIIGRLLSVVISLF